MNVVEPTYGACVVAVVALDGLDPSQRVQLERHRLTIAAADSPPGASYTHTFNTLKVPFNTLCPRYGFLVRHSQSE